MLTAVQKENLAKVFDAKAEKEQTLDCVANKVAAALTTDVLTKEWVKDLVGASGDRARKVFLQAVAYFHPHFVLNGTKKVIACDFIAATEENVGSKTIRQYRLSVNDEVVRPTNCANVIETEREESKTEKVTLESGWEIEVPSRDKEGNLIKETKKVQLVPRKKSVFGFTKEMKTAVINAIEAIENGTFKPLEDEAKEANV